jgi:fructose-1,6-bisphosphatase/inositol monophosphatase family enzyme
MLDSAELTRRRLVAEEAARAAGALHLRHRGANIEFAIKYDNRRDLVTIADSEAEAAAVAVIEMAFPG